MKANINKLSYIARKPNSESQIRDSDSWFTPEYYVELSRKVITTIDLDPFSSLDANKIVRAERFFDIENSAFDSPWFDAKERGTVFMNPPYSRALIDKAVDRFLDNLPNITQAVVLVNNATETRWFQKLLSKSELLCLVSARIAFENIDGKSLSGNTRGQVFFYYGRRKVGFRRVFSSIGTVLAPVRRY